MPNPLKRLFIMNATATIIFNYIGIFINLFIWEKGQSISDVAWFNMIFFSSWVFTFICSAQLLTKTSIRVIMRASALLGGITFLLLAFVHFEPKLLFIATIAIPAGAMNGFYFSALNLGLSLFGKGREFGSFFSTSNLVAQIISFLNPLLFAIIINWIGFSGSFLLMFVFISIMVVVSYYVPHISLSEEKEPLMQNIKFTKVFATPSLKWMVPSLIAAGFFMQFQGIFSLIFTFSVTKDKLVIALLQVMYTTFTVISMLIYKSLKNRAALHDTFWLTFGMIAASIGLFIVLVPKAPILILSNILTTVGLFFFFTIWNSRQFDTISQYEPMTQARILIWREVLLCFSRIVMLTFILAIDDFHGLAFKVIMIFSLASALTIPYFSSKGISSMRRNPKKA